MIRLALNLTLFLYVFGVFIFSKVEGLSLATNVALLCLLVVLAVRGLKSGLAGLKYSLIILPLAFILFLSIFWSRYPVEALISFVSFLTASVGGIAIMLALMNGATPKSVFWAAFLGSSYLVYSAWQEKAVLALSRVAGLAGNANELGITLTIAALLLSSSPICEEKKIWPKIYAVFLVLFSVYFTGSRTMLFVLFLMAIGYFAFLIKLLIHKSTLRKLLLHLLLVGFLVFIMGPFLWESFSATEVWKRTVEGVQGLNLSSEIRKQMIKDGVLLWLNRPFLGYGINQFRFETAWDTYSHSNYIEMLVSAGLLGLFSYYGIFLSLIYLLFRKTTNRNALIWFALLLPFLWGISAVPYYMKDSWLLIGISAWAIFSGKKISETKMQPLKRGEIHCS